MTDDDITERRYTYVQAFYPNGGKVRVFLVNTPAVREARKLAPIVAQQLFPDDGVPESVHVYPRNYVQDARALFAKGLWGPV